jgi:hypothetical protein
MFAVLTVFASEGNNAWFGYLLWIVNAVLILVTGIAIKRIPLNDRSRFGVWEVDFRMWWLFPMLGIVPVGIFMFIWYFTGPYRKYHDSLN